jgi:DNA-binding HxlR family transcriptional regulator
MSFGLPKTPPMKTEQDLTASALALIDAIEGIQDWSGTYVGDCIKDLENAINYSQPLQNEDTTKQSMSL